MTAIEQKGRGKTRMWVVLCLVIIVPLLYVPSCIYVSARNNRTFDAIKVGDKKEIVIQMMGVPAVSERQGIPFFRYASEQCQKPCIERLWYENRLSFDTEAWSFEIDEAGRVTKMTRWLSP